jgi:hypothetical protein
LPLSLRTTSFHFCSPSKEELELLAELEGLGISKDEWDDDLPDDDDALLAHLERQNSDELEAAERQRKEATEKRTKQFQELDAQMAKVKMHAVELKRNHHVDEAKGVMRFIKLARDSIEHQRSNLTESDVIPDVAVASIRKNFVNALKIIAPPPQQQQQQQQQPVASPSQSSLHSEEAAAPPIEAPPAQPSPVAAKPPNLSASNSSSSVVSTPQPDDMQVLLQRLSEYTSATKKAVEANDRGRAAVLLPYVRVMKAMVQANKAKQTPVDASRIPEPLSTFPERMPPIISGGASMKRQASNRRIQQQQRSRTSNRSRAKPRRTPTRPTGLSADERALLKDKQSIEREVKQLPQSNQATETVQRADLRPEDVLGYEALLEKLTAQRTRALQLAKKSLDNKDNQGALTCKRIKDSAERTADLVKIARRKGYPPPDFCMEDAKIKMVKTNDDLGEYDLELTILNCEGLPKGHTVYIQYVLPYPKADQAQDGQTSKVSSKKPEFNHTTKFKMNKRTRAAHAKRFTQFTKLSFELFSSRMIFSDSSLGSGAIKLKSLADLCDCEEKVRIETASGDEVATLLVRLRTQKPIIGVHYDVLIFPCVVINKWYSFGDETQQAKPDAGAGASKDDVPLPAAVAAAVGAPNTATDSRNGDADFIDDNEIDVDDDDQDAADDDDANDSKQAPDNGSDKQQPVHLPPGVNPAHFEDPLATLMYFSNDVLEAEIESLNARIQQGNAAGQDTTEILVRKSNIEVQMNALVAAVQSEDLSISEYLTDLVNLIERDTKLAVALKQHNRLKEAGQVLRRAKIMKKELALAKENGLA